MKTPIIGLFLGLEVAVCVAAAGMEPRLFWVAYLEAYLLLLGIALGCLLILLIHQLVGGRWGFRLQNLLVAGISTLPLLLLLHLPLWLRVDHIYGWQHRAAAQEWYLNTSFFHIRALVFWCAWLSIAHLLRRQIDRQRREERPETNPTLASWALMVSVLTVSLAAVDWIMSLEPRFHSSIFGLIILVGFMLSGFAWIIIARQLVRPKQKVSELPNPDLGNLLLMSVMLWAYGSYSQLLLIWSGQLPEEIRFYQNRFHPPWQGLGWALVIFGFALPFLLLLSRRNKQKPAALAFIAGLALIGHWLELIWHIQPNFAGSWFLWLPLSLLTSSTLGGIWLLLFRRSLQKEIYGNAL